MGLLVDIEAVNNATMADVKDVYIRVERLFFFPKIGVIRGQVGGYINTASGYKMKEKDIQEVKLAEEFFYTNEVLNGTIAESIYHTAVEDEMIDLRPRVIQTGQEPMKIFSEYYSLFLYDNKGNVKSEFENIKLVEYDKIFGLFYNKLKKYETRFENIRDVIIDPKTSLER